MTGLGIANVGKAAAKSIMKHFKTFEVLRNADMEALKEVKDIGEVSAQCIYDFFHNEKNEVLLNRLKDYGVNMEYIPEEGTDERFLGQTFVITGTLPNMDRKEAAALIEKFGGKVSGSVSKKTNYVLAGENAGSKLTKANELGIMVISEEKLLEMTK